MAAPPAQVFTVICTTIVIATYAQDATIRLARANNAFGLSLLKELHRMRQGPSVFFSSASVSMSLGLLYAGARGKTLSELSSVLGLTDGGFAERNAVLSAYKSLVKVKSANATLCIASAVLIKPSVEILDTYKRDAAQYFQAVVRSVDFLRDGSKVAANINEWVSAKTKGKIPRLIGSPLPMNTVMYLTNAVHFKGTWLTKFRASETNAIPFYNHGRDEVKVPTMSLRCRFAYARLDEVGASALAIPYAGNRFSMIVVLPNNRTGLSNVGSLLTVKVIENLTNDLAYKNVILFLPKFKLDTDYDLVTPLRKLGVESAFGSSADFSGISSANDLTVSSIKHKAFVEVNEEGTRAAAVSSVRVIPNSRAQSYRRKSVTFRVEHPFFFFIWDSAYKQALFMGVVTKL